MKLPVIPTIKTWNPTKLHSHDECPLRTGLRYSLKLCPLCFKGTVGFDKPCDKCRKKEEKAPALKRGIEIDEAIAAHINGQQQGLVYTHEEVEDVVLSLREGKSPVSVKHQISLNDKWEPLPKFTKGPWFWGELDVLLLNLKKKLARVVDWKTGGIDKRTGAPREEQAKYTEQLEIYGAAVLATQPAVEKVAGQLVFVDTKPGKNPIVTCPPILRKGFDKLKKKLEGRIKPMMSDTTFAPRPGYYCSWCSYSKDKGGPCPVA